MKLVIADTMCVSNQVTMNAEPFERKSSTLSSLTECWAGEDFENGSHSQADEDIKLFHVIFNKHSFYKSCQLIFINSMMASKLAS